MDQKLKKYILVRGAMLVGLALIILLFSGPSFKLTQVSAFQIPGLKGRNAKFTAFNDAVLTSSDSLIDIVDAKDSLITKSYCYTLKGEKRNTFAFPTDPYYKEPQYFKYLNNRNELAIVDWWRHCIDFYTPEGMLVERKMVPAGYSAYMGIGEIKNSLDYVVSFAETNKVMSTIIIKEQPGFDPIIIKRNTKVSKKLKTMLPPLQITSNGNNNLSILEVDVKHYSITTYQGNKVYRYKVKRDKSWFPWAMKDYEQHFLTGNGFVSIGVLGKELVPLTERIYDFKGRYLGTLNLKKMQNTQLVDISGNNLICFEPKTATVRVFKLELKKWFGLL